MSNMYYDPEKFGLTIVGEIDRADSYEFDKFVVWRKADGSTWYCTDSGCSCPSPFEDEGINDLQPFSEEALRSWVSACDYRETSPVEVAELIAKAFS